MFCRYCGAELDDGAPVCGNCGKSTRSDGEPFSGEGRNAPVQSKHNAFCIASFAITLAGILTARRTFGLLPIVAFAVAIAGLSDAKRKNEGRAFAIISIVLCSIAFAILLILVAFSLVAYGPGLIEMMREEMF